MSENSKVIHINDADFEEQVIKSTQPVLVDFWAPWCGPCRMIAPTLDAIAQDYENRLKVAKINVDDNKTMAGTYGVKSIPTMILFKDGQALDTLVGLVPKERLETFIKKAL